MSTFYAAIPDLREARLMLDELLRDGVRPEDLSLIATLKGEPSDAGFMAEYAKSVGDASSFVGRSDDPVSSGTPPTPGGFDGYTTLVESDLSGIDTSDSRTDVDSVDQMEDSQSAAEDMLYPPEGVSQGDHQSDDDKMALLTGFSRGFALEDSVRDTETSQEEFTDTLESFVIPGMGLVIGGGALATAALDAVDASTSLVAHLCDEGLSREDAQSYVDAYSRGEALVAVAITPGSVNEGGVETIAERHRPTESALFDAPRY